MINPAHKLYRTLRDTAIACIFMVIHVTLGGMLGGLAISIVELRVRWTRAKYSVIEVAIAFVHTE
jgi:hypothetical protein